MSTQLPHSKAKGISRADVVKIWIYLALAIALIVVHGVLENVTWPYGNAQLHTIMEVVACLVALVVGVLALLRYYTKKNNTILLIGVAFFGTALLDGYHAVLTSSIIQATFQPPESLIPWSWNASRTFLAIVMLLSFWAWTREQRLGEAGKLSELTVYLIVLLLTVCSFCFFVFVPLPPAYYRHLIVGRPEEYVAAVFFLGALIGYLKKGAWRKDAFEEWIIAFLIVSLFCQATFMPRSYGLFDGMFDMAHLLKIISYTLVLVGLLFDIHHVFTHAEQSAKALTEEIARRQEAEAQLRVLNETLEQRVERRSKQLVREEFLLNSLMTNIPDPVFFKDRDSKFIRVNKAMAHDAGLADPSELVGKTDADIWEGAFSDETRSEELQIMETGEPVINKEEMPRRKDGPERYVLVTKMPLRDASNAIIGTFGVARDITEHKQRSKELESHRQAALNLAQDAQEAREGLQKALDNLRDSEALYHSLVDNLPVSILRKDPDGKFVFANNAYCRFTGHSAGEIIGKTDLDFSPPEVAMKFAQDDRHVLETGEMFEDIEVNETDGQTRWVQVIKTPVRDARNRIIGTQAIFWDVSERQRAVDALHEAKEAADEANRAKSEFLANMSHEIRTPMTAIIGLTEIVLGTDLSETQREHLTTVLSAGESLLTIINEILDFSKIESGKLEIEKVRFNLHDTVGDAMKSLAIRAQEKDLELLCFVDPKLPVELIGDPVRTRQLLSNLTDNAIKFTHQGEIVVRVEPDSAGDGQITLHYSVRDTGVGIAPEKLERIFEAFEQADMSTTRRFGGTGLGLAICSRLAELMKGRIWVESEPGQGATFHFTIPCRVPKDIKQRAPMDAGNLKDIRILVVDDNETNRTILDEILKANGMQSVLTASAKEAFARLKDACSRGEPFRLLLSDFHMPEADGFQLAEWIRSEPDLAGLDIIFLSSSGMTDDVQRRQALNITARLTKPVKQSELFNAITRTLGMTVAEDEGWLAISAETKRIKPLQMLLVEDSAANQRLALAVLEPLGHKVAVANNGSEGLQRLARTQFDVVLMDVQMPVMDGLEATSAIRRREEGTERHMPIIAMTAHAMAGDREKCLNAGMDDYVSKPLRKEDLFAAIARSVPGALAQIEAEKVPSQAAAIIDWSNPLKQVGGNQEILADVVEAYVTEIDDFLNQLPEAIERNNAKEVQRLAHTLKGAMAFFSAERARESALQLETIGREGRLDDANPAFEELRVEAEKVVPLLARFVETGEMPTA